MVSSLKHKENLVQFDLSGMRCMKWKNIPQYIKEIFEALPHGYKDHCRLYRDDLYYYLITSPYLNKELPAPDHWEEIPCIYYHSTRSFLRQISIGSKWAKNLPK